MTEKLQYVRMKNGDTRRIYRVVDDKSINDRHSLVLLIVDGENVGHYVEAYPEEVEPISPHPYDMGVTEGPAD